MIFHAVVPGFRFSWTTQSARLLRSVARSVGPLGGPAVFHRENAVVHAIRSALTSVAINLGVDGRRSRRTTPASSSRASWAACAKLRLMVGIIADRLLPDLVPDR